MSEDMEIVCLGRALVTGGKLGSAWAPLEAFKSGAFASSYFGGGSAIIGGIYSGPAKVDEAGKLLSIPKRPAFLRMAEGEWEAARLTAEALEVEKKREALEKRIKADKRAMAEVRGLARILKSVPYRQRYGALQAIAGMIDDATRKAS